MALPGLNCGTQNPHHTRQDAVPQLGMEPGPLHWDHRVFTTEQPEKPHLEALNNHAWTSGHFYEEEGITALKDNIGLIRIASYVQFCHFQFSVMSRLGGSMSSNSRNSCSSCLFTHFWGLLCWPSKQTPSPHLQGRNFEVRTGFHQKPVHSLNVHWKDWCWSWSSNTLCTWYKEPAHWKRPWCWERLRAGGEGTTGDEMVGWHHRLSGHEFNKLWEMVKDRGAWRAAVHGVKKSQTWVSDNRNAEPWSLSRTECLRICLLTRVYASDEHWADFLYLLGTNTATFWVSRIFSLSFFFILFIYFFKYLKWHWDAWYTL